MPREQNLFHSVGFFWKKESVNWRASTNAQLLGRLANQRRAQAVNFKDQAGVYILYSGFTAVYAGQVGCGNQRLFERLKQHARGDMSDRWDRFSWFGLRDVNRRGQGQLANLNTQFHPTRRKVLNHLEAILLYAVEPSQNLQSGRLGRSVKVYEQVKDEKLPPTPTQMLVALCKQKKIDLTKIA